MLEALLERSRYATLTGHSCPKPIHESYSERTKRKNQDPAFLLTRHNDSRITLGHGTHPMLRREPPLVKRTHATAPNTSQSYMQSSGEASNIPKAVKSLDSLELILRRPGSATSPQHLNCCLQDIKGVLWGLFDDGPRRYALPSIQGPEMRIPCVSPYYKTV